jgi:hypothetical protein
MYANGHALFAESFSCPNNLRKSKYAIYNFNSMRRLALVDFVNNILGNTVT